VAVLPVVLAVHIVLALSLLVPSMLLPFAMRTRNAELEPGRITHALIRVQTDWSFWIGSGVALSGAALVLVLGTSVLTQPWLALALVLYAADLVVAFVIQRPGLRRLVRLPVGSAEADRERWRARARRQRYTSYVMATTIGLIAFLMMTKPSL
jgi:Predicted integral membrane protein (DUF2269)